MPRYPHRRPGPGIWIMADDAGARHLPFGSGRRWPWHRGWRGGQGDVGLFVVGWNFVQTKGGSHVTKTRSRQVDFFGDFFLFGVVLWNVAIFQTWQTEKTSNRFIPTQRQENRCNLVECLSAIHGCMTKIIWAKAFSKKENGDMVMLYKFIFISTIVIVLST